MIFKVTHKHDIPHLVVYLQQNKKKTKTEGKKCHAKTMWSQKKPIELIRKTPHMCRLGKSPKRKGEGNIHRNI